MEDEADQLLRDALMELFDNHSDPIEIIKWPEIYQQLEDATDRCEDVADDSGRLRRVLALRSHNWAAPALARQQRRGY